jgi:hypothetical protein
VLQTPAMGAFRGRGHRSGPNSGVSVPPLRTQPLWRYLCDSLVDEQHSQAELLLSSEPEAHGDAVWTPRSFGVPTSDGGCARKGHTLGACRGPLGVRRAGVRGLGRDPGPCPPRGRDYGPRHGRAHPAARTLCELYAARSPRNHSWVTRGRRRATAIHHQRLEEPGRGRSLGRPRPSPV